MEYGKTGGPKVIQGNPTKSDLFSSDLEGGAGGASGDRFEWRACLDDKVIADALRETH